MQHGTFNSESVQEFYRQMKQSGNPVQELSFSEGSPSDFSRTSRNSSGNFSADLNQVRGEYIENYDYTRCERPNGTFYGTGGTCRKGTEAQKEPSDKVRKEKYSWGTLMKVSKGSSHSAILHPEHQDQIRDLKNGEKTRFKDEQGVTWNAHREGDTIHLVGANDFSSRAKKLSFNRAELPKGKDKKDEESAIDQLSRMLPKGERIVDSDGEERRATGNFSEFDYTRCERPNGTFYGTGGTCRKGAEVSPAEETRETQGGGKTRDLKALDAKWEAGRKKTYDSLKGKSKEELLSILSQHQKIHGADLNTSVRDLKGAIMGAIHGNDSPSEIIERNRARFGKLGDKSRQQETAQRTPEEAKKTKRSGRPAIEMSPEDRIQQLQKRQSQLTTELRKSDPYALREAWKNEHNGGRMPTRFPSTLRMAQDVAYARVRQDIGLAVKRREQLTGPKGQEALEMATEMMKKGASQNEDRLVRAGSELYTSANKLINREIQQSQDRGRQLQSASSRLFRVEMDLRNRTNKMDAGYEPNDPKVRARLEKVQKAKKKVDNLLNENMKYRKKVEGPLRDQLKAANERLEALAEQIRQQKGPASKAQIEKFRGELRGVQLIRKRLQEGPRFSPDLGGKGGVPDDQSKLYESLKIEV